MLEMFQINSFKDKQEDVWSAELVYDDSDDGFFKGKTDGIGVKTEWRKARHNLCIDELFNGNLERRRLQLV